MNMELAQLLISPGMLLAAFIFFWKQNRIIIDELKSEIVPLREEITSIRVRNARHERTPRPRRRSVDDPGL